MSKGQFYVTEKLGPKQSLTPEGFLLCEEVPVARTGMMIYGPNETPVAPGSDGITKIFREEQDVFRPETIASAQGKPVTNDHPNDDVTPNQWQELTHGIMLNVRRGEGAMDDLLIADLLITTVEGIKAVQDDKREVSLGYEADYEEVEPGVGRQTNILINHIALVDQGRCGPRCAIRDGKPKIEEANMKKRSVSDKLAALLRRAYKAKDSEEFNEIVEDANELELEGEKPVKDEIPEDNDDDKNIHIHLNGEKTNDDEEERWTQNAQEHEALWAAINELKAALQGNTGDEAGSEEGEGQKPESFENAILDEVPEELKEESSKVADSRYLGDSFRDAAAMAEILVPGIAFPVFDAKADKVQTFKKLCGFRRKALDEAYKASDTRAIIQNIIGGRQLQTKSMTCDAVRVLFNSASAMKRATNNVQLSSAAVHDQSSKAGKPLTLAELNERNRARYSK